MTRPTADELAAPRPPRGAARGPRSGAPGASGPFALLPRAARPAAAAATALGLLAGVATAGLLALIHAAAADGPATARFAGAFAATCAAALATRVGSALLLTRLSQDAIYDLRLRLCRQLPGLPLRELEALGPARLLAVLTEDVATLGAALPSLPVLGTNIAVVASCLAYLAWLSPRAFGAFAAFLAVAVVTYQLPIAWARRRFQRARDEQDALFQHLRTLIEGAKELKLSPARRERFFAEGLGPTADRLRREGTLAHGCYVIADGWGSLLAFLAVAGVLFGRAELGLGTHAAGGYALVILFMVSPLQVIFAVLPTLAGARVALRTIAALGASLGGPGEAAPSPPPGRPGEAAPEAPAATTSVELAGVRHAYRRGPGDHDSFTLGPLDLTLRPGEIVFVVGGNGSGKSTLAKVLTGLYEPEAGTILWNGAAVGSETRDAYRQQFSAVFSDFFLFDDLSVRDESSDERARELLARLRLARHVTVSGGALSTIDLSQGQKKRLALLSALLEDRPAYVFDEWAADQDPAFKEIFYTQLLPELRRQGKLVLVISHDDRYFGVADRVHRLEDGRLAPP